MLFVLGMFKPQELSKGAAVYGLVVVFVMTIVHVYTYKNGFMWCGKDDKVYKKDEPKRFTFWLVTHTLILLGMLVVSVYTLFT